VDFTACLEEGRSKGMAYIVKAAQYVAKGAGAGGTEQREQLAAILRGPLAGRPFLRASPKLTSGSRVTMRNLRDRRTLYARQKAGSGVACAVVEKVMILEREREARDRTEREFVGALARAFCDLPPPYVRGFRTGFLPVAGIDYGHRPRRLFSVSERNSSSAALDFFSI